MGAPAGLNENHSSNFFRAMPTYEYVCEKCDCTFEKFQSISDQALSVCPKDVCRQKRWGKGRVKRQIGGGAGLLFKGSGFYITDYRSDSYKQAAKKETTAASGTAGAAGGASQGTKETTSKPAAKPAPTSKAA